jgi:hypothetical protein
MLLLGQAAALTWERCRLTCTIPRVAACAFVMAGTVRQDAPHPTVDPGSCERPGREREEGLHHRGSTESQLSTVANGTGCCAGRTAR